MLLLFAAIGGEAKVYTPSSLPSPKESGQGWYVANPDAIIADSDVVFLNRCAADLEAKTNVEMCVAAVQSIGETECFDFCYELFQRWGIGKKGQNTGVLVFFAMESHDVRIMTGVGLEGVLPDARCSQIIHDHMIPAFRAGDFGGGLCLGALRIYEVCTDSEAPEELRNMKSVTNRGKYAEEDEAEEDNFNPASVTGKPKAQEGDIYRLGRHRLICGDSTEPEVLQILMGDQKADLLLTDPPYNVDYSSKNEALNAADKGNRVQKDIANDKMEGSAFQDFLFAAFNNANPYLKPGGAFYIWHAGTEGLNFKLAVQRVGWELKQILIWVKNNIVLGRQDYQWKHEPCLYGWKPGASHYFVARRDLITITEDEALDLNTLTKQELKDLLTKVLSLPTTDIHEDKPLRSADHPTMKPLMLMGRLIKNSTRPSEVVLDPFGGSGSTMMAAEQLGRACYMVELDPVYTDVICKRYEELTGEKAEYLGNFKTEAK